MGENRASGEGILGDFFIEVRYVKDSCMLIMLNTVHFHSFYAEKSKYVHIKSFGYGKCEYKINLAKAIMIKNINGDKNYA